MKKEIAISLLWSEFIAKINSEWDKKYQGYGSNIKEAINTYGNKTHFASFIREDIKKIVPLEDSQLSVKTLHSYFQNNKFPTGIQHGTLDIICKYLVRYNDFQHFIKKKEDERTYTSVPNKEIDVLIDPSRIFSATPKRRSTILQSRWFYFAIAAIIAFGVSTVLYSHFRTSSQDIPDIDSPSLREYLPQELTEGMYFESPVKELQEQEFLKYLTYLDVRATKRNIYALATMISKNGKGSVIKDPDNTPYYEYDIFVVSIDRNNLRVMRFANPFNIRHGAIDFDSTYIHVFTQNKTALGYDFSGVIHSINISEFKNYQHAKALFHNKNMGIAPFFKHKQVHHFSASGHFYAINDSLLNRIKDRDYFEVYQKEISQHSDGILDSMAHRLQTMQANGEEIFRAFIKFSESSI